MNINNHLTFRLIDGSGQRPNMVRIGDSLYIVDKNAVLRLNLDGSLEKSFGGDGVAYLTDGQLRAYHVAPSPGHARPRAAAPAELVGIVRSDDVMPAVKLAQGLLNRVVSMALATNSPATRTV